MIADLELLCKLQEANNHVALLDKRAAAIPGKLAELDRQLGEAEEAVRSAEKSRADAEAHHRKLERDLEGNRTKVAKYESQLWNVKTNRELEALRHEIETLTGLDDQLEEQILQLLEDVDAATDGIAKGKVQLAAFKEKAASERRAIESQSAHIEHERKHWVARRDEAWEAMSATLRKMYDRIAKGRGGVAVVPAIGGACGGCHVNLRPQLYTQARLGQEVVQCDSCNRILYYDPALDPDLAEVESPDQA